MLIITQIKAHFKNRPQQINSFISLYDSCILTKCKIKPMLSPKNQEIIYCKIQQIWTQKDKNVHCNDLDMRKTHIVVWPPPFGPSLMQNRWKTCSDWRGDWPSVVTQSAILLHSSEFESNINQSCLVVGVPWSSAERTHVGLSRPPC